MANPQPPTPNSQSRPFSAGEFALLVDRKGKHYMVRLDGGGVFHFHQGVIRHDDVLDQEEGVCVRTSLGSLVWAYRPTMFDYLMQMPRNSAIMYPKDIAFLLMWADVFPGARVFEAGVGSGALAIALLRTIGPTGKLVTYETRLDMIRRAETNAHAFLGPTPSWTIRVRDVYEGIDDGPFDRLVLDVPDPGRVAPHAARCLVPGGIICSYVPNVTQVHLAVESYRATGVFAEIETYETLFRPWEFRGPTARPIQTMISHTGFLTLARRGQPRESFETTPAD